MEITKEIVEKFNNKKDGSILHYFFKNYTDNDFIQYDHLYENFDNQVLLFIKQCINNGANINAVNDKNEELFYIICNTFQYGFDENKLLIIQTLFQNGLVPSEEQIYCVLECCYFDHLIDLMPVILKDLKMDNEIKISLIMEDLCEKFKELIKSIEEGEKGESNRLIELIHAETLGILDYLENIEEKKDDITRL